MMTLDFREISDGQQFEDLVAAYFRDLKNEKNPDIVDVVVKPSGIGTDGGRDILVTFQLSDSLVTFKRVWVVQCKFHNGNISTNSVADLNIPTLLHSYNACGYLLICKKSATSKLTDLFERLEKNCAAGYSYMIWPGEQFKTKLQLKPTLQRQFFPVYYSEYLKMMGQG